MDREKVITHLMIIHTWAEFARKRDLQFFTAKHLENIAQWSDDALALLKEQKEKKDRLLRHISDVQYTMGGFADQTTDYDKGRYDGLEAAWRIIDDMI